MMRTLVDISDRQIGELAALCEGKSGGRTSVSGKGALRMVKALFDTHILIDYLNGIKKAEIEIDRYDNKAISLITWMEVMNDEMHRKGSRSARMG